MASLMARFARVLLSEIQAARAIKQGANQYFGAEIMSSSVHLEIVVFVMRARSVA